MKRRIASMLALVCMFPFFALDIPRLKQGKRTSRKRIRGMEKDAGLNAAQADTYSRCVRPQLRFFAGRARSFRKIS
jgi:hypothetical protein